ncbi:sigma-70 family RNA polymerase sigma factor [Nocardia sp. BSTN01]|uniref:sigma-70 family RNA polymerase sigma factor n=1 Tax=Nocardia sp. BSTN01 TaxID=2783665 RepID=UPI001E4AC40A|nr:sigma-70 family RNA polymerase sigma factor [Nocardia sp. BSTN01]
MRPMTSADTDRNEFLRDAQRHRNELIAHCYGMVGSVHEAEDIVQETFLRAWRGWESFEGRSSVRTWLYRIATNLCLTAQTHNQRRFLPSGLRAAEAAPAGPFVAGPPGVRWVEPFPNGLRESGDDDPAEIFAARSDLRLALVASLQHLPPRQRAVFILREVLAYSAVEVAAILEMSVPAVKGALQRARGKLDEVALRPDVLVEPTSPEARAILDRYIEAFEKADIAALTGLLRDDTTLESVPMSTWLSGKQLCIEHLKKWVLTEPGHFRMYPTIANGQPAAVAYHRDRLDDGFTAFGVVVLSVDGHQVTGITTFLDPGLVELFGFAEHP